MPEQDSAQLRRHLSVLWRGGWLIVLVAAITTAAALYYSSQQTPIYQSSAQVLVRPVKLSPTDPTIAFVDMETEQQIAQSAEVAGLASKALKGAPLGSLSVSQPPNTNTLILKASSTNRRIAQRSANAYAEAYLQLRRQQVNDDLLAASGPLSERIADLNRQIEGAGASLLGTGDENQRALLQIRINSLLTQKQFLEQKLNELILPENLRVGSVLRPGGYPAKPSRPNHVRTGALGVFVGLLLGAGVVLVRDRLDDRLHDREELESWIDAPVLAVVPRLRSWHASNGSKPSLLKVPDSEVSEAYKTLRTSFAFVASQRGASSVLIASCNPNEGKTSTLANLGRSLADGGKRVVLVSADLRKPRLHQYLGVNSEAGLTNVLAGERGLDALIWVDKNLYFLDTGPLPLNPGDILGSEQMANLIRQLQAVSDFVLVDSPAMLAVADALSLAPILDGVLLLADARQTRPRSIDEARYQLEHVGATILGAVLNNFDGARFHPYQHYNMYRETRRTTARPTVRVRPPATSPTQAPGSETVRTSKAPEDRPEDPSGDRAIVLETTNHAARQQAEAPADRSGSAETESSEDNSARQTSGIHPLE